MYSLYPAKPVHHALEFFIREHGPARVKRIIATSPNAAKEVASRRMAEGSETVSIVTLSTPMNTVPSCAGPDAISLSSSKNIPERDRVCVCQSTMLLKPIVV